MTPGTSPSPGAHRRPRSTSGATAVHSRPGPRRGGPASAQAGEVVTPVWRGLPPHGLSTGAFARVTGLTATSVRSYDTRGLFSPETVDDAGRRRFAPSQVGRGRLLAALVATGMPVQRAARVVRDDDRRAALARLEEVRRWLEQGRDHLPVASPDEALVLELGPLPGWLEPLDAQEDLLDQLRAARARCAGRLGCDVAGLPAWAPTEGLPAGPRVPLRPLDDERSGWRTDGLLLPAGNEALFGAVVRSEGRGDWWVTAPRPAEQWAHLLEGGAPEHQLIDRATGAAGLPALRRLAFDHDLASVCLLVRFV